MKTTNIYRNRTMDKIGESDVGTTLRIAGWVENIRDHGEYPLLTSGICME